MVTFLEWGITPDKLNDEPVIYKEDIVDIMEAKKLIAKGQEKLRKREEARQRTRSSSASRGRH